MDLLETIWSDYIVNILDIFIVSYIFYRILLVIKGTRTIQVVIGLIILVVITLLAQEILHLRMLTWLMNKFWLAVAVILAVIFQTEIRYGLAKLGSKIKIFSFFGNKDIKTDFLKEIVEAVFEMSKIRMGALIVIEKDFSLKTYTDQATFVDARVSHELLLSIFNTKAPIHDGAIIIKDGRIKAASCILPISTEIEVKHLGTRHRAAIGLSSLTDAIVVVGSEETGIISVVVDGKIKEYTNNNKLLEKLKDYCTVSDEKDDKNEKNVSRKLISRIKKIKLKDIRKRIMLHWEFKILSFCLALIFWMYIISL